MKLAWITDPHVDFLNRRQFDSFVKETHLTNSDGILITGDIANASTLSFALDNFDKGVDCPVYFLLGNHDYYTSTFAKTESIAIYACHEDNHLKYLPMEKPVRLNSTTCLIGFNGWADGIAGLGSRTDRFISDSNHIKDYKDLPVSLMFQHMEKKASGEGCRMIWKIKEALGLGYTHIVIATHVPLFAEASLYLGKPSGPELAPYFSSPTVGAMLRDTVNKLPIKVDVYCGHTHHEAEYTVDNITCHVGGAEYRFPKVSKVLEF